MLVGNNVGFFSGGSVNATKFNGSSDRLQISSDLSGVGSITKGIISIWVRRNTDTTNQRLLTQSGTGTCLLAWSVANQFYVTLTNGSGSRHDFASSAILSGSNWYHGLVSFQTTPSRIFQLYINDASDNNAQTGYADDGNAFTIGASAAWGVAAFTGGGDYFNGDLSEIYFAPNQYLDFSVTANRRKFIDGSGKHVNLGSDGSTPTGTVPAVYLGNPYSSIGTNLGNGGNFTVSGSPSQATTTPP